MIKTLKLFLIFTASVFLTLACGGGGGGSSTSSNSAPATISSTDINNNSVSLSAAFAPVAF